MGAIIFIGTMSVCACLGFLFGGVMGANRRSKDLEDLDAHWRERIAEQDKMHAEDVKGLMADHTRNLAREAARLHERECKRIQGVRRKRGYTPGAEA